MVKRPPLTAKRASVSELVAEAAETEALRQPAKAAATHLAEDMTTTAIHVPKATLTLLRRVALARVEKAGKGRASVSSVIADLVETNRADLEKEI